MAAVASDKVADSLQNLSLDAKTKSHDVKEATKKPFVTQNGVAANSEVTNAPVLSYDRSVTPGVPDFMDPSVCYVPNGYASGCYYGAYDGSVNEWENFGQYISPDGVDMSHGLYGDGYNHGYGYAHYGAYPLSSPVPTLGHDGQVYGHHPYQYQGAFYPPPTPTSSAHTPTQTAIPDRKVTTAVTDQTQTFGDLAKPTSNGIANSKGKNEPVPPKGSQKNSALGTNGTSAKPTFPSILPSGYQDPRFGSPVPWLDASGVPDWQHRPSNTSPVPPAIPHLSSARNQNIHHHPNLMGHYPPGPPSGSGYINRMYPNSRMYNPCSNALRTGRGFLSGYDPRANTHSWLPIDNKYRTRGRGNGFYGYGNENMEGLNELNRGPRSGRVKANQKTLGPNPCAAVKGQTVTSDATVNDLSVPNKDQYNQADFPQKYSNAKFYIIKSYSEDDVHKSVKYGVWASTPNGNKKLDAGFQEGQEKPGECPVFLFFSVNTSGQFVGVAEMVGPVDFNKTVEYWQQDKWNGCFPVKWHIVKDVPNSMLKHITLENNDNKPVTNSRDTQEVKFEQGLEMLKILKDHVSKTSILDDFAFYETRQKIMQDKRAKQQFQKQVWYGKTAGTEEKDAVNKLHAPKPLEVTSLLNKENGSGKPSDQSDAVKASIEAPKLVKEVPEKRILVNGISNGVPNGMPNGVTKSS